MTQIRFIAHLTTLATGIFGFLHNAFINQSIPYAGRHAINTMTIKRSVTGNNPAHTHLPAMLGTGGMHHCVNLHLYSGTVRLNTMPAINEYTKIVVPIAVPHPPI
jgi:hypothetical protein